MNVQGTRLVFTSLQDSLQRDVRFKVDSSVLLNGVSTGFEITGWAIHRKSEIQEVLLTSGKVTLAKAKLDIFRPRVSQHFKGFYNSESAGFKMITPILPEGKLHLRIILKNGKAVNLAEFELANYDSPKLLFMHIAKAAGSTVNSFFASHYTNDQYAEHIESNEKWRSSPDDLKKLHFLSGHIHLYALKRNLELDDYFKVTVVREPYSHLCSHLSWIRKLTDPGEEQRFGVHEAYIQKFASKLATVDFMDPTALRSLFDTLEDRESRLVDNCQVRYFTRVPAGDPVSDVHAREAIKASKTFDKIGTTDQIGTFLKEVAISMSWPEPKEMVRKNVTQNFYGLDTSRADIRAVLEPFVQHDRLLYDHIRQSND